MTDPPGLQTILDCHATEAFHPHPERPIYTVRFPELLEVTKEFRTMDLYQDADKGHVQIRDMPLEIVDLR